MTTKRLRLPLALAIVAGCINGYQNLAGAPVKVTGPTHERFGFVVKPVGDVNDDGHVDFAASSPVPGVDKVRVFFGPITSGNFTQTDADLTFNGPNNSEAGWTVAGQGDLNGDGVDDLVIGAPSASTAKGQVYVLHGPLSAGTRWYSSADVTLTGATTNGIFGTSIDIGDYNGDGNDDLLVGAPWQTAGGLNHAGKVYLYTGPVVLPARGPVLASRVFEGGEAGANTGWSVAFAGNMDGVGGEELVIGAHRTNVGHGAAGTAYVVWSGYPTGTYNLETTTQDIARIRGDRQAGELGYAVDGGGDIDGDGYDDILLGAPGIFCVEDADGGGTSCATDYGSIHLFLGGPQVAGDPPLLGEYDAGLDADATVVETGTHNGFGVSLAIIGDVNGGGSDDAIIGSAYNKAYLYYGGNPATTTPSANAIFSGVSAGDWAGIGVGGGDLNGDGLADVLIGAPGQKHYNDGPQAVAGRVYAYFGQP